MNRAGILLLVIGLVQIAGDVFGVAGVKAIGAALGASPAPKVFSSVRGLETFSTRFLIEWTDASGAPHSVEITPERYTHLRGPYNRRNVYGAVLAYGPVLESDARTRPMFDAVSRYAVCGEGPLLRELGIDTRGAAGPVRIRLLPREGSDTGSLPLVFVPPCA
jgi:hypothetical protein